MAKTICQPDEGIDNFDLCQAIMVLPRHHSSAEAKNGDREYSPTLS
jgi:hypothetical protein